MKVNVLTWGDLTDTLWEGLNNRRFWNFEGPRKCIESRQLHKEDCLQEVRVELRGNVGVRSISSTSEKGRNDVNE